jgi:hypothetical protein
MHQIHLVEVGLGLEAVGLGPEAVVLLEEVVVVMVIVRLTTVKFGAEVTA